MNHPTIMKNNNRTPKVLIFIVLFKVLQFQVEKTLSNGQQRFIYDVCKGGKKEY